MKRILYSGLYIPAREFNDISPIQIKCKVSEEAEYIQIKIQYTKYNTFIRSTRIYLDIHTPNQDLVFSKYCPVPALHIQRNVIKQKYLISAHKKMRCMHECNTFVCSKCAFPQQCILDGVFSNVRPPCLSSLLVLNAGPLCQSFLLVLSVNPPCQSSLCVLNMRP